MTNLDDAPDDSGRELYPDPRTPEQIVHDEQRVRRQITGLGRRGQDPSLRRLLLASLAKRRRPRDDQPGPEEPVQFDTVKGLRDFDLLVARGELLLRTRTLDDGRVRRFLAPYELTEQPVAELDGRITRLVNPELPALLLNDIARFLRQQAVEASVNHIAPLGPVGKGLGGPEPSQGSRPFPGVEEGGVVVAVVDTGITAEQRSDGWLQQQDVPRNGANLDPLDAFPTPAGDGFLDFAAGHGSFVSGVIQQVEPSARVRMYRALDSDGVGTEVRIAAAMVQAVRDGARLVNLSLGTETLDDQPPIAIRVALELIDELAGGEAVIVAAAGNFGTARPCWPAAFRRVVAVAGLTAQLRPTEWSSRGFWVDCSTVGEGLLSTYVEGRESWEVDWQPDSYPADAWAVWSGTSFAAPQLAGAIARHCRERGLPPHQALPELLRHRRLLPDFGLVVPLLPGT
jgi:subtilisin family serine protease